MDRIVASRMSRVGNLESDGFMVVLGIKNEIS